MQNKYVGDIGDYSKFVLIKHLFDSRCGLIWYLYPDEKNNDGIHIEYDKYDLEDISVVDMMEKISQNTINRNIYELERVLKGNGFDIEFFNKCIENEKCDFFSDYRERLQYREKWFNEAVNKVKCRNIVFVDPDNGTEIKSCQSKGRKKSGKYIFYDEINSLIENHLTVVIYQHLARKRTDLFISEKEKKLRESIDLDFNFYALKFKRKSPRVYLIISKVDKEYMDEKIKIFCNLFEKEFEDISGLSYKQ